VNAAISASTQISKSTSQELTEDDLLAVLVVEVVAVIVFVEVVDSVGVGATVRDAVEV
jgi:hypothetical protein